jgi:hypothetical protein
MPPKGGRILHTSLLLCRWVPWSRYVKCSIRDRLDASNAMEPFSSSSDSRCSGRFIRRPAASFGFRCGNETLDRDCYVSIISISSCERILAPQLRHTISAPGIRVSSPACSMTYRGASADIPNNPPHPACLLVSVVIRIVSIDLSQISQIVHASVDAGIPATEAQRLACWYNGFVARVAHCLSIQGDLHICRHFS